MGGCLPELTGQDSQNVATTERPLLAHTQDIEHLLRAGPCAGHWAVEENEAWPLLGEKQHLLAASDFTVTLQVRQRSPRSRLQGKALEQSPGSGLNACGC